MTTIVTRAGKGSPLTNNEMDSNLTNLNTYKVETNNPSTTGTLTHSGDIVLSGSGKRITGDFSNATLANRLMFQTSTVNDQTSIGVLPNGTNTFANISLFGGADPANASIAQIINTGGEVSFRNTVAGTGTYLPMTFYTGGAERMRIDTSGNVLVDGNNLKLFSAKSLTANGYQKLPSGLIIQWGRLVVGDPPALDYYGSISFPITFPNQIFQVNATLYSYAGNAFDSSTAVTAQRLTGFDFTIQDWSGGIQNTEVSYIALGY